LADGNTKFCALFNLRVAEPFLFAFTKLKYHFCIHAKYPSIKSNNTLAVFKLYMKHVNRNLKIEDSGPLLLLMVVKMLIRGLPIWMKVLDGVVLREKKITILYGVLSR